MGTPLKNPPVYFTVAQVRFNPILKLDEFLPAVQEAFRHLRYSDFLVHPTPVIKTSVQDGKVVPSVQVQSRFSFGNAAKTHSFLLDEASLTLQSTAYGTFEDFSDRFLAGLELLHRIVDLDFIARVGLRYLDHVRPLADDAIDQYLCETALGQTGRLEGEAQYSLCETVMHVRGVKMISRVLTQHSPLVFPPDLSPLGLEVNPRFLGEARLHAMLDTDGFTDQREPFSIDAARGHLDAIHGVIGKAFHAIVTEHAREMWNRGL